MRPSSPLDEYSYDYIPSSPPKSRSSSPFHFLHPIIMSTQNSPPPHSHSLSSSHHHHGRSHRLARRNRKEREAQEMARLLDPSYQSASLSTPSWKEPGRRSSLEVEAFIDMDGDLHDPDFRYFPAAESFVSQTRGGVGEVHGRSRRRSGSSGRGAGASSPTSLRRRPYWELDSDHPVLSDEEEEEEILAKELGTMDFLTQAGHGNGTSASESSAMRSRRNNLRRDGGSYGFVGFSGYSSSAYHSPAITTSTLPTSYESDNTMLSTHAELEEEREKEKEKEKEKGLLKWRRRIPRDEKEAQGILETTHEEDWQAAGMDLDEETQRHLHLQQEHVPTCGEAFKRHWLSLSLRFRTSVYRSQRRVMRRVLSLF